MMENAKSERVVAGAPRDLAREPVSRVEWVHRDLLKPNHYNPNRVAPPELELLITSILEDGFTQPIVVLPDYTIVDGFHRYLVSGDLRLMQLYGGMVPGQGGARPGAPHDEHDSPQPRARHARRSADGRDR